ncbi:hypothetical protein [Streptomyces sp. NPDC002573]|uniref:hypothetical protein n=1 Tax=Streptomyces sp. NPDC002573 TaxID=3364651 RepID=UPI0036B98E3A
MVSIPVGSRDHKGGELRDADHADRGELRDRRQWTTAIRRAVGPLAELTTHTPTTSNADWPTAVRHALTGLNADLAEDPDQVTTLAEHATTRTTYA